MTELFGDENIVHVVVEKEDFVLLDRLVALRGDLGHHGRQMILFAEEIIVVDVTSEVRRVTANDDSIGFPGRRRKSHTAIGIRCHSADHLRSFEG